ncbi:hypothetical protein SRHO_G00004720 [Serrasalmus rhombeus]
MSEPVQAAIEELSTLSYEADQPPHSGNDGELERGVVQKAPHPGRTTHIQSPLDPCISCSMPYKSACLIISSQPLTLLPQGTHRATMFVIKRRPTKYHILVSSHTYRPTSHLTLERAIKCNLFISPESDLRPCK